MWIFIWVIWTQSRTSHISIFMIFFLLMSVPQPQKADSVRMQISYRRHPLPATHSIYAVPRRTRRACLCGCGQASPEPSSLSSSSFKTVMQNNNKRSVANPLPYVAQCGSRPVANSDQLSHLSSACPGGVRLIGLSLFSFFTQWWLRSTDSEVSPQHTGFPIRTRASDKLRSVQWAYTSLINYVILVLVCWWRCLYNDSASFIQLTLH